MRNLTDNVRMLQDKVPGHMKLGAFDVTSSI